MTFRIQIVYKRGNHMKNDPNKNKGFSLVELIIVIAIMAILAAAIAPALIRYINKARKADDKAAADALGSSITAAFSENEYVYSYLHAEANSIIVDGKKGQGYYRIVCFMNAGYAMTGWGNGTSLANLNSTNPTAKYLDSKGRVQAYSGDALTDFQNDVAEGRKELAKIMSETMGAKIFKLKFTRNIYMDQWIITVDEFDKIHVFVGGGLNNNCYYIDSNHISSSSHRNRLYEIWPECDSEYNKLEKPPSSWITN